MSLKEIFPTYPLSLRSPRGSRIKFGTRDLYVDFPWQAYHFMTFMMDKSNEVDLNAEGVRKEWHKFLQHYKAFLTLDGKPLISVFLRSDKFSGKKLLMMRVKWNLFVEYLEEKVKNFMLEVGNSGKNVTEVYREIWVNFFSIRGEMIAPKSTYFPSTREKFKKLLKRTGDYSYLKGVLDQFEDILKQVEEIMKNRIASVQLYTTNLIMDIQHLRALIDIISIPPAYLLLRSILENFVKFFVYLDLGKSFDLNFVLSAMFLYEYEADKKQRRYSLNGFKDKFIRKFSKITATLSSNKTLDTSEVIRKLKEKQVPTVGINRGFLEEFSSDYGLDRADLKELHSACSEVIHNQPPLPFFSLLEVKFFKHFLEKYVHSLQMMAERLIGKKIEMKRLSLQSLEKDESLLRNCLKIADLLSQKYDKEIKSMIKESLLTLQKEKSEIFVSPITLTSLFYLISSSLQHLREYSFIEEDMEDIINRLQPLSFKVSIWHEVYETLNRMQEIMLPKLERYEIFSSLRILEKRRVVFYLLVWHIPRILEELF